MFKKLMKALRKGHRREEGITGLETAIILIAFVTVAAVFGYAVLSAGIFSAEKGKETVYVGLKEAKSTLEIEGSIIAVGDNSTTPNSVKEVKFNVGNAVAGEPIDMTRTVLTYIDQDNYVTDMTFTTSYLGDNDGDDLLEVGEQAQISVDISSLSTRLVANKQFTIEFSPPYGSIVVFERTVPANIDTYMDLY
jgi:flagellin FlaB